MIDAWLAVLLGGVGGIIGAVSGMGFVTYLMGRWMARQEMQKVARRIVEATSDNGGA